MSHASEFERIALAYPGHPLAPLGKAAISELREERDALQAQLDALGGYQVFIVPGLPHLDECLLQLNGSPDVRDGDHVRVAGTSIEFVRLAGIWTGV